MRSEASFAALAGTSPVDVSSGKQRHRLNRGGDRQLNWALRLIALQRVRHHPEPTAYFERLLAAGKTVREARRCVKRALARRFLPTPLRDTDAPLTHRSVGFTRPRDPAGEASNGALGDVHR
jgi:transposase